jgi:hypothetical protein
LITANGVVADGEREIVDGLIGDRRGDDYATANIDTHMRGRLTLRHPDDLAFELVAGA